MAISKLNLIELRDKVVNPKTEEEAKILRHIFSLGGWKYLAGTNPDEVACWQITGEETCFQIKNEFEDLKLSICKHYGIPILSFQEFLETQGITESMLEEIKKDMKN